MSIHESEVTTDMFSNIDANPYKIKVIFSDKLKETSLYDIAYSSVHGGYLPYIFTGYFYDDKFRGWYFSNARRHEEMKNAVILHLGREMNYVYGQMHFCALLQKTGILKINQLVLHGELPEGAIPQLRRSVRRDRFSQDFFVSKAWF